MTPQSEDRSMKSEHDALLSGVPIAIAESAWGKDAIAAIHELSAEVAKRDEEKAAHIRRANFLQKEFQRAEAERDALKRHAEAMADAIQFGDMAILTVAKAAADSYRSDYPKDPK